MTSKVIELNGVETTLEVNALSKLTYKRHFNANMLSDMMTMLGGTDNLVLMANNQANKDALGFKIMADMDEVMFYQILWTLVRTADESVPPFEKWLADAGDIPTLELIEPVIDILFANLKTKKK